MDGRLNAPAPVVIGQDEQSELHVQPLLQSGRRHLDIRMWRRGPTGFAPSRNALTLAAPDLDALQAGISELLQASGGGQTVARVVWDNEAGRRLRAETEPFGTRYQARLGFWQRVRDSWKPADDGLTVPADQLQPLQQVLSSFSPWVHAPATGDSADLAVILHDTAWRRWPSPGGDWLTVEPTRIAFHPRGLRITGVVEEDDERHVLVLHQWRRKDSLWLPDDAVCAVDTLDLHHMLTALSEIVEADERGEVIEREVTRTDGTTLRMCIRTEEGGKVFRLEERQLNGTASEDTFAPLLDMPAEHVPRFARALIQGGTILIAGLFEGERAALRRRVEEQEEVTADEEVDSLLAQVVEEEPEVEEPPEIPAPDETEDSAPHAEEQPAPESPMPIPEAPPIEEEPPAPVYRTIPLSVVRLGRHEVRLARLEGPVESLILEANDKRVALPLDRLGKTLADVRHMYYEALLGRRGRVITVGDMPPVQITVDNEGTQMCLMLETERDGLPVRLSFPAGEVPAFLDAAGAALSRTQED